MAASLALDHIPFERLDPFLVSFYDLVVNSDIVTRFEFGEFLLAGQLLMYVCNGAHVCDFKEGKGRVGRGKFQIN